MALGLFTLATAPSPVPLLRAPASVGRWGPQGPDMPRWHRCLGGVSVCEHAVVYFKMEIICCRRAAVEKSVSPALPPQRCILVQGGQQKTLPKALMTGYPVE